MGESYVGVNKKQINPILGLTPLFSLYLVLSNPKQNVSRRFFLAALTIGRCRLMRLKNAALMLALSVISLSSGSAFATALEDASSDLMGPPISRQAKSAPVPGESVSMMTPAPSAAPVQISELPPAAYVAGVDNELFRRKLGLVSGYIQSYNKRLAWNDVSNIAQAIVQYSDRYSIDFRLLTSLIAIESGFRANAISSSGAIGMGQLKPDTAHWLGVVDPYNPVDNIAGTARFLSWLVNRYKGNLEFALSAYYQGPGFVDKNGIAPVCMPYLEKVNRALGPMM
jgi:soluble lytic murein transglycosylase-like protein